MVVESVLLGDLIGSFQSAGHVNSKLIRVDRHWSRLWSRLGYHTGQKRAHNEKRHPEDHLVDGERRRRVLRLPRAISPAQKSERSTFRKRHVLRRDKFRVTSRPTWSRASQIRFPKPGTAASHIGSARASLPEKRATTVELPRL